MDEIIYRYITFDSEEFIQAAKLRFSVLFEPYSIIERYDYDELDSISSHLVALNRDRVVAYSRMTEISGEGKITNVAVGSQYLNRGIGFEMMKINVNKARELELYKLDLNARLETVGFYKKIGFKCEGNAFISEKSGLALQKMCINLYVDK